MLGRISAISLGHLVDEKKTKLSLFQTLLQTHVGAKDAALIPAWGNAPGMQCNQNVSAKSAIQSGAV